MTSPIKTLFPLLLALTLLAGCKGTVGNDPRSSAAGAEKSSPTPTNPLDPKSTRRWPREMLRRAGQPHTINRRTTCTDRLRVSSKY